ncbi:MAG: ABC transporter substrate-binding protein [Promethearchaeota archaeon]
METLTKRIIAIVLIAVIGVGIGVTVWFFVAQPEAGYKRPGAPSGIPDERIIKIGILGDTTDITGEGAYKGAYAAIKKINEAGGITGVHADGPVYFALISVNTYEAEPFLDIAKGTLAAEKMMTQYEPDFVIGGFRTEAVMTYRETVLDEEIIFINTGAATDSYCLSVLSNYARYKYCFRAMPINSTSLAKEITEFYALAIKPALEAEYPGLNVTKVAILREDLEWTVPMSGILNGVYKSYWRANKTAYWYLKDYHGFNDNPWFNFTIVDEIAYPITATSTDFTGYMNQLDTAGAQVVCPIISAQGGIKMMTQYAQLDPKYMIVGIDVMSQLGDDPDDKTGYWYDTDGGCNGEIIMQSTTRTNKTTQTIAMWDEYRTLWKKDPLYTAVGSYGAVELLAWAINGTKSIDSDTIVAKLETITPANPREGAGGWTGFTSTHDLYEGYDPATQRIYSVTLWVQWQDDGTKKVVTSGGHIYPEWIVDTPIQFPTQGINT